MEPWEGLEPIDTVSNVSVDEYLKIRYEHHHSHKVNQNDGEAVWIQNLEQAMVEDEIKMGGQIKKTNKYDKAIQANDWRASLVDGYLSIEEYKRANMTIMNKIGDLKEKFDATALDQLYERKEVFEWIGIFLNMIIDPIPNKPYNQTYYAFGVTYATAFEYFAAALLREMNHDKQYEVSGQSNDKGADIKGYKNNEIVEVGQVKMGLSYFQGGKGNSIVLQLVGTCVYFGVKKGIIISSESKESLTKNTQDIIDTIAKSDVAINIETIFIEDIEEIMKNGDVSKAYIIENFNSEMPKKYPAGVPFEISCTCGQKWKGNTTWSLRTKIYEIRQRMRDGTGYMDTDLYKHVVATNHEILWAEVEEHW